MKKLFQYVLVSVFILLTGLPQKSIAQTLEWRLSLGSVSLVDPDGGGLATGSATFILQVHTTSGTVPNVTGISTGWSWQSTRAMLPTGSPCGSNSVAQPGNITMSTDFATAGFTYNNVNECSGSVNFTTGGQTFDRRAVGTVDGGTITLTTAWVDVFTVTIWALGSTYPAAGYAVINSGSGGTPGAFNTYAVSDDLANEYVVNSLTYTTPLALPTSIPVSFSSLDANCTGNGAMISWSTESESNSKEFVVEKSMDGTNWSAIGKVNAAGNSASHRRYQFLHVRGGNALYRVKEYDADGRVFQTDIIRANCGNNTKNIVVYPVPAHDVLNVAMAANGTAKTHFIVTDMSGRQLLKITPPANAVNFDINISGLAAGNYVLQFMQNNQVVENIQFVKQ